MNQIFTSASKIVLLILVLALTILTLVLAIFGVTSGRLEPKDELAIIMAIIGLFNASIMLVLGFYFGVKGTVATHVEQEDQLAGK